MNIVTNVAVLRFTRGYTSVLDFYKKSLVMSFNRMYNTMEENVEFKESAVTVPVDVETWSHENMYDCIDIHKVLVKRGQGILVYFKDLPKDGSLDVNIELFIVHIT